MSETGMPKYAQRPIAVVSGIGNGSGTGNATAREFAKNGYRVALIARRASTLHAAAKYINSTYPNGDAAAFHILEYTEDEIHNAFTRIKAHWPGVEIRVAVFNTGHRVAKPFFEHTEKDIEESVRVNIGAAFAFSREAILAFRELEINGLGNRGVLMFTSATAGWRGTRSTSGFATGKYGVRGLSQSLAKEFGKQNIHVAHCLVDGIIRNDMTLRLFGTPEWKPIQDVRVMPTSIAKAYWYLAHQDRSAWTWELDLRPAHEHW